MSWVKQTDTPIHTKPLVKDGLLYFGDLNNYVYALYASNAILLWKRQLLHRDKSNPQGIKSNFVFHKSSLIVVTVDGFLYSLNDRTGDLVWGPIDLEGEVYSSPVIVGSYLFIVTAKRGRLFVINVDTGKAILKKFIGFSVETTPAINLIEIKRGAVLKRLYNVYITLQNKLLFFRIHIEEKVLLDITTIPITNTGSYVSSPIIHSSVSSRDIRKNTLFFSTRNYIYSINADLLKVNWIVKSDAILISKARKPYPSPFIIEGMLFFSNRAYDRELGSLLWKAFLYGVPTTDSAYSKSFIYFGGSYISFGDLRGYIACVDRRTESIVFHNQLSAFPLSPITASDGAVYFSTNDSKLYAFR